MIRKIKNTHFFPYDIIFIFGLIGLIFFIFHNSSSILDINSSTTRDKTKFHTTLLGESEYEQAIGLQQAFVKNAKNVGPSVVNISHAKEIKDIKNHGRELNNKQNTWYPLFKAWLQKIFKTKKYISKTIGSGIILNNNGYIITNYHVIKNKSKILVRLSDNRDYFAKIVGTDSKTDLAVVKINSFRKLPIPVFDIDHKVEVGQWVMAIGNPYGLQGTVTVGVVSGIRQSELGVATYENYIQTDASINPGNSGGPLINLHGNIIGINTSDTWAQSGVGFAIPIKMALKTVEELIKTGEFERGWLGVGMQEISPDLAQLFKVPNTKNGILVNKVENDTPAENGGIITGDIITQYDGKKVTDSRSFQRMIANTQVGKKVIIKVIRNGSKESLVVTIGKLKS